MRLCIVYISCKLLYMFRLIPSPIIRSGNKLYLQHLALIEPYATFRCRGGIRTAVLTAEGTIQFDQCHML
jgi:hypothetical protein